MGGVGVAPPWGKQKTFLKIQMDFNLKFHGASLPAAPIFYFESFLGCVKNKNV
jgi:hypothetical protein